MAVSDYTPLEAVGAFNFDLNVFIATPMSAYEGSEYAKNRAKIIDLVRLVRNINTRADIFCPAMEIVDTKKWDLSQAALEQDMLALERAQLFIMAYLRPLPLKASSVLVEAGIALSLRVPSIFIVDDRNDLPYMLRDADQLSSAGGRHRKTAFKTLSDLSVSVIETRGLTKWESNKSLYSALQSKISKLENSI